MSEDKLLIDINTADEALLIELPGIGKARAEAICEYRRANGSFASIDDVLKVPGIGRKTFDQIKGRITIGNASHGKRD